MTAALSAHPSETQFHHVSFTVSDMDVSAWFWSEAFGFKRGAPNQDLSFSHSALMGVPEARFSTLAMTRPGIMLELLTFATPAAAGGTQHQAAINATGTAHLGFMVDDINAKLEHLVELGAIPVGETVRSEGKDACIVSFLRAPDGIIFEIFQNLDGAASEVLSGEELPGPAGNDTATK